MEGSLAWKKVLGRFQLGVRLALMRWVRYVIPSKVDRSQDLIFLGFAFGFLGFVFRVLLGLLVACVAG